MAPGLLPLINDTIFLDDSQCVPIDERGMEQDSQPSLQLLLVSVRPIPADLGRHVQKKSINSMYYTLINSCGIFTRSGEEMRQ